MPSGHIPNREVYREVNALLARLGDIWKDWARVHKPLLVYDYFIAIDDGHGALVGKAFREEAARWRP